MIRRLSRCFISLTNPLCITRRFRSIVTESLLTPEVNVTSILDNLPKVTPLEPLKKAMVPNLKVGLNIIETTFAQLKANLVQIEKLFVEVYRKNVVEHKIAPKKTEVFRVMTENEHKAVNTLYNVYITRNENKTKQEIEKIVNVIKKIPLLSEEASDKIRAISGIPSLYERSDVSKY